MRKNFKTFVLGLTLIAMPLASMAQIEPSYWARYTVDITGTNTFVAPVKVHTNMSTAAVIPVWQFTDGCLEIVANAWNATAAGEGTNATFVFVPVTPSGASMGSGGDWTAKGQAFNVILGNPTNITAGASYTIARTNFPALWQQACSWRLWMITNSGANGWSNITIKYYGRTPQR